MSIYALITIKPLQKIEYHSLLLSFHYNKSTLETFKTPSSPVYLYPFQSSVLKEIRFLFKFEACLMSARVMATQSYILIMIILKIIIIISHHHITLRYCFIC